MLKNHQKTWSTLALPKCLLSAAIKQCVVPENIHTHPKDDHWKFRWGGGSQKPEFLRESMSQNWKFQGGRVQTKKPSLGSGYGYFLEPHNAATNTFVSQMCNLTTNFTASFIALKLRSPLSKLNFYTSELVPLSLPLILS